MKRRKFLTAVAATGTLAAAGCLDILEDGVEAEAEPAEVPADAAAEYGYEHHDTEPHHINETIEIADESRDIDITTWAATYAKDAEDMDISDADGFEDLEADAEEFLDQQGAGFAAVSTPSESIAGQEVNPIAHLDEEEVIEQFNDEVAEGEVRDIEHADEHDAEMLGEEVTVEEFDAIVETEDGDEFDIQLYVAEARSADDIVLAVAAHPEVADETDDVLALVEAVEHPVDAGEEGDNGSEGNNDE